MKSTIRLLPTTLVSLMLLGSGIGTEAAQAQFSRKRPQSFPEAARRWGYDCRRQDAGYFCRYGDRDDRWEDRRNDQWEDRHGDRSQFNRGRLYEGRTIRTSAKNRDRLVIRKNDDLSLTLYIDEDIRADDTGRVIIPRESRIEGRLRSRDGGTQFEAKHLILPNGRRYDLDARSEIIYPNRRTASRRTRTSSGAREILATILGDIRREDTSRRDDDFGSSSSRDRDLIVVYPNRDLDLRLTKDLKID